MAGEAELYSSSDCSLWRAALAAYSSVLELKAEGGRSKKSEVKGEKSIIQLDKWYQQTLPELITGREKPHLTHAELNKLMTWKLTRGKFRPRLTELVRQNQPDEVEKVTQEAIELLPNLEAAIKHLCQLKAIGPATASAVLCAASPELVPFMADESVLSVPGLGKIEYNLRHYMKYATKLQEKMKQLNRLEGKSKFETWSCHDVEKALWAHHLAKKFDIMDLLPQQDNNDQDKSDEEEVKPKAKRQKKET